MSPVVLMNPDTPVPTTRRVDAKQRVATLDMASLVMMGPVCDIGITLISETRLTRVPCSIHYHIPSGEYVNFEGSIASGYLASSFETKFAAWQSATTPYHWEGKDEVLGYCYARFSPCETDSMLRAVFAAAKHEHDDDTKR